MPPKIRNYSDSHDTALCALKEPKFFLRASLREALKKNFVPHTFEKFYVID